ncbi:hypothetical protein [Raoultella ornithinolytica]|uniref:hypothetical protein n=1 Tax=Raoultella ornithinolytica TaxID=54291 RepID=UPI000B1F94B9|nr:hypothetical protein [Raoultella ornithinolytica]
MSFENWTIEDLFTRCMDCDDMTLEMDRVEFAALRRKIAELQKVSNSPVIPDGSGLVSVPDEFLSTEQNARGMFELSEDCMCRLAVALSQQNKGLVTPPGYVMVPVEPTKEILDEFDSIIDYGAEDSVDAWHRLLAAAPQEDINALIPLVSRNEQEGK